MKRNLSILFCLIASYSFISAQVFQNSELKISKLEDNMWVIETSDSTGMFIIEGSQKSLLIDTGTKCSNLDSIVKLITQKPLYVVITHAHGDHDGNIGFFKEIYMHQSDIELLNKKYKGKINFVNDGDVFDLGDKQIEVSHMPAHTPGSIVLLDKKDGICYSGDAFGSGQVWLQLKPGAPIKTYINSCKKMEDLMANGINKLYCSHYSYIKKAYDKSYMDSMLKLAEALYNGTEKGAKKYPRKIGCKNPMMVTDGEANIVYDPKNLK